MEKRMIKRIDLLSAGKILGITYAAFGFIAGAILSLLSVIGIGGGGQGIEGLFLGVGAIIILPIIYGILGFVGGLISSGIYNLAAGAVGGLEIELE